MCCALLYLRFVINPTLCLCNGASYVVARIYSGVTALTSSFSGGSENLHHKENHLRFCSKDLYIGGSSGYFTHRRTVKPGIHILIGYIKLQQTTFHFRKEQYRRQTELSLSVKLHTHELQRGVLFHIDNLYHCLCISLLYRPVTSGVWTSRRRDG